MFSSGHSSFTLNETWQHFDFVLGRISHSVYKTGVGPGVLIMHELPGMTPQCVSLAERIRTEGFCVYLPLFFGQPGQRLNLLTSSFQLLRLCIRREFYCLAKNQTSPISEWLRALCRKIHEECGGNGVGAIGMCLTGNLVIPLMLEPSVLAPIACQPAVPFAFNTSLSCSLGVSHRDLSMAAQRSKSVTLYGYRFATDRICPAQRFQTLAKTMGSGFVGITIPTGPDSPFHIKNSSHAVFTEAFVDDPNHPTYQELHKVLDRFKSIL
jgi:dienelactone hydrolase